MEIFWSKHIKPENSALLRASWNSSNSVRNSRENGRLPGRVPAQLRKNQHRVHVHLSDSQKINQERNGAERKPRKDNGART